MVSGDACRTSKSKARVDVAAGDKKLRRAEAAAEACNP